MYKYFNAPNPLHPEGSHKIAYTQWGKANEKVLFCVHGLSRNSRDFDHIAKALSDKYHVICIDIVGRGKSDWLENSAQYNYSTYISDCLSLLGHLGIKQVDWLGTSMGGVMGMIIASQFPGIIQKMIINDVGPVISGKALGRILDYVGRTDAFTDKEAAQKALRKKLATFGITSEEHWEHMFEHSFHRLDNGDYLLSYDPSIIKKPDAAAPAKIEDIDLWHVWDEVNIPSLVLRGGVSDILSAETAKKMVEAKNGLCKLVEIPNVGHAPTLMDADQIAIVRNWLL